MHKESTHKKKTTQKTTYKETKKTFKTLRALYFYGFNSLMSNWKCRNLADYSGFISIRLSRSTHTHSPGTIGLFDLQTYSTPIPLTIPGA